MLEVIGKPKVIVIQERNQWGHRAPDPDVVRSRLLANVAGKVEELDTTVVDRLHNLRGVIGACVSHHEQLPVTKCLTDGAAQRTFQRRASVVRGDDDRDCRLYSRRVHHR